jgi:antitoxin component YwqK of YwqJK toxin-antitoxin module
MEWLKYLAVEKDGDCIIVNGDKEGARYIKRSKNRLSSIENYINDERHGIQLFWSYFGRLTDKLNYINGKKHGIQLSWYRNGQLKHEENYTNGKKHGKQIYYSDGVYSNAYHEGYYINGECQYSCY